MAVTIKYNNQNPFTNLARTPLVARREEIVQTGKRTARADIFTLSGKLKRQACDSGFESIYNLTKSLILNFAENFKKFEVIEDSNTIYSYNQAIVESISFDEDKYYDLVPFQIVLRCYKESYAETFGVLNPSDEYSFDEGDGCIVNVTHTVSATGINNSSDAVTNARSFISSLLGYSLIFNPIGYTVSNPVLVERSENVNRLTGEVSISEKYIYDKSLLSGTAGVVQRMSTEFSLQNGIANIIVSGTYQGALNSNIEVTRNAVSAASAYSFAAAEYSLYNSLGTLNSSPIEVSVSEDIDANTISYSFTFTDNPNTDPYLVDKTTITQNDWVDCIRVELQIKSDYGCPAERIRKTKDYYSTFDIEGYVDTKWALYGTGKFLGSVPDSQSTSFDHQTGTISLSVSYCSNNYENCNCLENLKYTLSFNDPLPQYAEDPALEGEGCYAIQDLRYISRARFSIAGSARPLKCCSNEAVKSQIASRANQLMSEYFAATDIILDGYNIEVASDKSVVTFNFSWNGVKDTFLPDDILPDDGDYLLLEDGFFLLLEDGGFIELD